TLRLGRTDLGLTLGQVSRRSGVSTQFLSEVERGLKDRPPRSLRPSRSRWDSRCPTSSCSPPLACGGDSSAPADATRRPHGRRWVGSSSRSPPERPFSG